MMTKELRAVAVLLVHFENLARENKKINARKRKRALQKSKGRKKVIVKPARVGYLLSINQRRNAAERGQDEADNRN